LAREKLWRGAPYGLYSVRVVS